MPGMTSKFAPGYLQPTIASSRNPALDMWMFTEAAREEGKLQSGAFSAREPALSASDPVIHDAKLSVEKLHQSHCGRLLSF